MRTPDFPYLIAGPGKIIAANKKFSVNFEQYVHSMGHTARWRGLGLGPSEYSVLHHVVVVALLNVTINSHKDRVYAFWKGIFHELGEVFYGDIPTPFKTDDIRSAETVICVKFSENLVGLWKGYYGVRMRDMDCKRADLAVAEIEAPFVLGISDHEVDLHGLRKESTTDQMRLDATLLYRAVSRHSVPNLKQLLNGLFDLSTKSDIDATVQRSYLDQFNERIFS